MVAGGHIRTDDLSDFTKEVTTSDLIIDYLRQKHKQGIPTVTRNELVKKIPRSVAAIDKALGRLKRKGIIENPFYGNWKLSKYVAGDVTNSDKSGHIRRGKASYSEGGGRGVSDSLFVRLFDPRKPVQKHNLQFFVKGYVNKLGQWSDVVEWVSPSAKKKYLLKFFGRKNGRIDLYVNCSGSPLYPVQVLQLLEYARGYLEFGLGVKDPRFVWVNWDTNQDHRDIHYRGNHLEIEVFEDQLFLALYRKVLDNGEVVARAEAKFRGVSLEQDEAELLLFREDGILKTANVLKELGHRAIASINQVSSVSNKLAQVVDTHQVLLTDAISSSQRVEQTIDGLTIGVERIQEDISSIRSFEDRQLQVLESVSEVSERQTEILSRIETRTHSILSEIQEVKRWVEMSQEERQRILELYHSQQLQIRSLRELARLLQTHHSTISQWIQRNQNYNRSAAPHQESRSEESGSEMRPKTLPPKYASWWPAIQLIIESHGSVSYVEIMRALGIARTYAAELLAAYWKAGYLSRKMRGRKYLYYLEEKR